MEETDRAAMDEIRGINKTIGWMVVAEICTLATTIGSSLAAISVETTALSAQILHSDIVKIFENYYYTHDLQSIAVSFGIIAILSGAATIGEHQEITRSRQRATELFSVLSEEAKLRYLQIPPRPITTQPKV